jgi:hypothetical protein
MIAKANVDSYENTPGLLGAVFLPNLPFGLAVGAWLIVKGIRDTDCA